MLLIIHFILPLCFLVGPKHAQGSFPIKKGFNKQTDANELVVFQDAQALPVFLVYVNVKQGHSGSLRLGDSSSLSLAQSADTQATHLTLRGSYDLSPAEILVVSVVDGPDSFGSWTVELVKRKPAATLVQQANNGAYMLFELPGEKARVEVNLDGVSQSAMRSVQDLLETAAKSHYCSEAKRSPGGLLYSIIFQGKPTRASDLFQALSKFY